MRLSIDYVSLIISRGRGHGEWAEPPPYEGGPPERFPPEPPTPTDTGQHSFLFVMFE